MHDNTAHASHPSAGQRPLNLLVIYDTYEYGAAITPLPTKFKQIEATHITNALRRQGHDAKALDMRHLALSDDGKTLSYDGKPFNISDYDGVCWRCSVRADRSNPLTKKETQDTWEIAHWVEQHIPAYTPFDRLQEWDGKIPTKTLLDEAGVEMPRSLCLRVNDPDIDAKIQAFTHEQEGQNFVLKKDVGHSGIVAFSSDMTGLYFTHNVKKLQQVAHRWLEGDVEDVGAGVVLQDYIKPKRTLRFDVTVGPDDHKMIFTSRRFSKKLGYYQNADVSDLDPTIKTMLDTMVHTLGPGCWGIDIIQDEHGKCYCLEANPFSANAFMNSNPQLAETYGEAAANNIVDTIREKQIASPHVETRDAELHSPKHAVQI